MPESPLKRHPHAASRTYEGEAVVVVPALGEYDILNPVGTRVWELVDGTRTVEDIVKIIVEEYDVDESTAGADVRKLVEDFKKHQMLA
jgi:hypothetical protein